MMTEREMIAVLEAWENRGKKPGKVEFRRFGDEWDVTSTPSWDFLDFDYRFIPDPPPEKKPRLVSLPLIWGKGLMRPVIAPPNDMEIPCGLFAGYSFPGSDVRFAYPLAWEAGKSCLSDLEWGNTISRADKVWFEVEE